jgi:hypothetical protein
MSVTGKTGFVSRREAAPRARLWEHDIVSNAFSLSPVIQAFERANPAGALDYKTRVRVEPDPPTYADARISRAGTVRRTNLERFQETGRQGGLAHSPEHMAKMSRVNAEAVKARRLDELFNPSPRRAAHR